MYGVAESCSLVELMEDPLIGLVMKSDGVDRHSLELLFGRLASKRAHATEALRSGLEQPS
jgi:hypothetical protein